MKSFLPSLLLLSGILAGAGCQSRPTQPTEFVISVTSSTPVTFSGHLRVDGKEQAVSGTTPAEYKVSGQRVACQLVQGPENGLLTVQIRLGIQEDAAEFVASSGGPNTGLHGTVNPNNSWQWLY